MWKATLHRFSAEGSSKPKGHNRHVTLKLGFKASAEQFDPRELVEIAVAAEGHGMESVTVSDHFQPWRHEGGHAPFSLTWMAAVGERTKTITIGTSVMTPTFRYNPAVIAQAFATMGCLYPGRVFLGVGTGEALNEIATGWNKEWPEFKERFARLRESVDLMRALWTGDRVNFEGEYYTTVDANIYDRPDAPIPVYIAAGGPFVARYAGRAGDGFICTSKSMSITRPRPSATRKGSSILASIWSMARVVLFTVTCRLTWSIGNSQLWSLRKGR